ncbi:MAG: Yip1 family protein [Chakrabartia sp.]
MDSQNTQDGWQQKLITRVKNILLQPKAEWDVIDGEAADIGGLYKNYIMILAAIPPLATMIHGLAFGHSMFGITYRPSIMGAVGTAITTYIVSLIGVFVLALVIDGLAPSFGAAKNRDQAFKVAAYTGTASWVAGIFGLIPGLGFLGILGLYSLYLLYLGLPKLMKVPDDKAMGYTVVSVIAAAVLFFIMAAIATPVAKLFSGGASPLDSGSVSGTLSVPGVGSVDMGKLEALGKQAEAASKQFESGKSIALAPDVLEGLLPATVAGMARTKVSSAAAGAGGIGGSNAEARYEEGANSITLQVTDMAAMGAIAGLGSALNVQSSEKTETSYEKTGTVDGRMTSEKWDSADNSGKYSVVVANRFMVEASGNGTTMEALKAAVAGVGVTKLEGLAQ